jgi:geranylgeranyl pyrophosphate synthase
MPQKIGKILVADFTERSKKGLDFAKKMLQNENINDPKLRKALEYYLSNWGNFSQPGLVSVACEAVGGDPNSIVPAQASIAIMVAAFDIHDDIIDKSLKKHGKFTVYGKFGPEIALLVGNAFLIEGMKLFADAAALLPKQNGKVALEVLKSRLFEIGNAHGLELAYRQSKNTSLEDYLKIIEMKAASIEADIVLGALFGGAEDTESMVNVGRILGKLIMLREEFVDLFDTGELMQRLAVLDLPLPIVAAMQETTAKREIRKILSKSNKTASDIEELLKVTLNSKPVENIKNNMQLLINDSTKILNKLPPNKQRETIKSLLAFMLEDL